MFTGTLRFNLVPEEKLSDDKIMEVLKEAQLDDLLTKDS
jgi:ABC-type multidrug transport system fused ATPase/permease subunit